LDNDEIEIDIEAGDEDDQGGNIFNGNLDLRNEESEYMEDVPQSFQQDDYRSNSDQSDDDLKSSESFHEQK